MGLTRAWRVFAADLSSICSNRLQTLNVWPIDRLRNIMCPQGTLDLVNEYVVASKQISTIQNGS